MRPLKIKKKHEPKHIKHKSLLTKVAKKNKIYEYMKIFPKKTEVSQYRSTFEYNPKIEWEDMVPDRFHFKIKDQITEFREALVLSKGIRANKI